MERRCRAFVNSHSVVNIQESVSRCASASGAGAELVIKVKNQMRIETLRATAVALACTGMLIQPMAMAATPQTAPVTDIALRDGGMLVGQVMDSQGAIMAKVPVALIQNGKEIARLETDQRGKFAVKSLKGGVYQVATVGQHGVYRMWAPRTAPPAAKKGLMLVSGDVVRGQGYGPAPSGPFSSITGWISQHPLMTAGIVATAIAIPLAIDDDDDPPASP